MRYFFFVAAFSLVLVLLNVFGQKQKDYKIQQADAYYLDYRFQDALAVYNSLLENTSTTDSIYSSLVLKSEKANMGIRMLSAVEDIQIVDSIKAHKSDFFSYYKLEDDAGRIFSDKKLNDSIKGLPLTGYISQRQDRIFSTDTIHSHTDISTSYKLFDGWSQKQALSSTINTGANENFPFMLSDGVTLYYCSDGEHSLGGYDIFMTRFSSNNNDFLIPENAGMPFNSPYNDYLMVVDDENDIGWFASDRYQHKDSVIIYTFKPNEKRTFVSSENSDYVLNAAKLKAYSLFSNELAVLDSVAFVPIIDPNTVKSIHFVINDSIVYTSLDQFTSNDAKQSYEVGLIMQNKVKEKHTELEQLRNEYKLITDNSEKKKMILKIHSLETECGKISSLPNDYYKKARNLEIKKISNLK